MVSSVIHTRHGKLGCSKGGIPNSNPQFLVGHYTGNQEKCPPLWATKNQDSFRKTQVSRCCKQFVCNPLGWDSNENQLMPASFNLSRGGSCHNRAPLSLSHSQLSPPDPTGSERHSLEVLLPAHVSARDARRGAGCKENKNSCSRQALHWLQQLGTGAWRTCAAPINFKHPTVASGIMGCNWAAMCMCVCVCL